MTMERAVFVPDIDRLPPPGEPYDRLYLGSEFCAWRLPSAHELHAARAAATSRGMSFSLVTPFLDEPGLTRTLALIRALPDDPAVEVVANDLGLIEALRADGWRGTVVAGRLLTRQRRGPGFQSFGGIPPEAAAALRGSALDSPAFVELLGSAYGVKRFELDDLVQGVSVPALPAGVSLSLYRPYLLVTATRNCPWIFDGQSWDRSHGCPRPCCGTPLTLHPTDEYVLSQSNHRMSEGVARRGGLHGAQRSERNEGVPAELLRHAIRSYAERDREPPKQGASISEEANGRVHGGPQRQDPAACTSISRSSELNLVLSGCAQFLEHRSDAPPPSGIDRIVWQPGIPA